MLYKLQKPFYSLIALFFVFTIHAQTVDFSDYQAAVDYNAKADVAMELWNEYVRNDLDSLQVLAHDILSVSVRENALYPKAVGEFCLASYLIRKGKFPKGIRYMESAIGFFGTRENHEILSIAYNELGHAHFLQGDYKVAIEKYNTSIKHGTLSPDPTSQFNGKLGMGKSYCAIGDTLMGIELIVAYKNESLKHLKFESVADAYAYLGEVELKRNPALAKSHFEKSMKFSIRSKSKAHLSHSLNNQAIVYYTLGNLDSALIYFNRSLDIRKEMGHIKGISESYNNLGFYYQSLEQWEEAEQYYNLCIEHCRANNLVQDELDALNELLIIYRATKDEKGIAEIEGRAKELDHKISALNEKQESDLMETEKLTETAILESETNATNSLMGYASLAIAGILLLTLYIVKKRRKN